MPIDGGDAEEVLARFAQAGVDDAVLAAQLQKEGAAAFSKSWGDLIDCIKSKCEVLGKAA